MQTIYNSKKSYFQMVIEYEQKQAKCAGVKYDPEILLQINSRLGQNKRIQHDDCVTLQKNLDLNTDGQNRYWHNWHNHNMKKKCEKIECSFEQDLVEYKKLNGKAQDENIWAFITVGFDDKIFVSDNPDEHIREELYRLHAKKITEICWRIAHKNYDKKPNDNSVKQVRYVIEKHRELGIHHHCHFLFQFNKKVAPSDMINKIFAVADFKDYSAKNFIQYDGPQRKYKPDEKPHAPFDVLEAYIHGDKKDAKLPLVALDDIWRVKYNIDKLYLV